MRPKSKKIRQLRDKIDKLTPFARKIGMKPAYLSKIETGKAKDVAPKFMYMIARGLKVEIDVIREEIPAELPNSYDLNQNLHEIVIDRRLTHIEKELARHDFRLEMLEKERLLKKEGEEGGKKLLDLNKR